MNVCWPVTGPNSRHLKGNGRARCFLDAQLEASKREVAAREERMREALAEKDAAAAQACSALEQQQQELRQQVGPQTG